METRIRSTSRPLPLKQPTGVLLSLAVLILAPARLNAEAERIEMKPLPVGSNGTLPATSTVRTGPPDTQPAESPGDAAPTEPTQVRGPKYNLHRWADDFSYLDGPPNSYNPDLFDPIKRLHLDDDWTFSLGGSHRGRLESRTNNFINLENPTQNTRFLHRQFLHADLEYRNLFRFYIEGIYAEIENNDLPLLPIDENRFDFYQFFFDVRPLGEEIPLTFRAGRQELRYGAQRLISPLDWANTRRRFEGFRLFWTDELWNADVFYTYTVPVSLSKGYNRKIDHFNEDEYLIGMYVTYKGIPQHGIDLYYIYYRNANELPNADGNFGSLNLNTIGGRLFGNTGPWDYDTELAGQFGEFGGDPVQAWMWALDAGFTFEDVPWEPRIGFGADYASGDADPGDGKHQTFNQLFPLGHKYLGYIDLIGRQNMVDANVNLTLFPIEDVAFQASYHAFWLAENLDGLYNAGGVLVRRDPSGNGSYDVGQELDLTVSWELDDHTSILLGYSYFWTGDFINETGLSDNPQFVYFQYEIKF